MEYCLVFNSDEDKRKVEKYRNEDDCLELIVITLKKSLHVTIKPEI